MVKREYMGSFKLQEIGLSLMVTVPKQYARAMGLKKQEKMKIFRQGKTLILEKEGGKNEVDRKAKDKRA